MAAEKVDPGTLSALRKGGAKGVGKLATLGRVAGSGTGLIGGAFLGYELYQAMAGRQSAAHDALDAYNAGQGQASVSSGLMRDIQA